MCGWCILTYGRVAQSGRHETLGQSHEHDFMQVYGATSHSGILFSPAQVLHCWLMYPAVFASRHRTMDR